METKRWLVATLHFDRGLTRKRSECTDWAMGWTVRGSILGGGMGYFFSTHPDRFCFPPILVFNWYVISSRAVKRPGHEVNNSPPSGPAVEIC